MAIGKETEPLVGVDTEIDEREKYGSQLSVTSDDFRVYRRRWYCLFLYSLLSFIMSVNFTSFGPVAHAFEVGFGWTTGEVALISSWPSIMFILTIPAFAWVIDNKGMRVSCLIGAGSLTAGSALRCISSTPPLANWLFHLGQILIGAASPVVLAGASAFSNTWFPLHQCTLSTTLSTIGSGLGLALGYIMGPLIVPLPDLDPVVSNTTGSIEYTEKHVLDVRADIMIIMYICVSLSLIVLLLMLYYFPAKPPTPPSLAAGTERTNYLKGIRTLVRIPKFWVLVYMVASTNGIFTSISNVLDVDLKAKKIPNDQLVAGWLSSGSYIAAILGCLPVSTLGTRQAVVKWMLIALSLCACAFFVWFALIVQDMVPSSLATLVVSYIAGAVALNAPLPLLFELACDVTYPIGEGLTVGVLILFMNITVTVFLVILTIPNIGTGWLNWVPVAASALAVPLLAVFKPAPQRSMRAA